MAYDKNTDYMAEMNRLEALAGQAVRDGDSAKANEYYRQAAQAEAMRNEKIKTEGLNYQQSSRFHGFLGTGNGTGEGAGTPSTSQEVYDRLKNYGTFQYDPQKDQSYLTAQERAKRLGKKAMEDTVANVAARTGGMASSYAGTVGQQAYSDYLENLNAAAPEYEKAAYERWRQGKQDLQDEYTAERERESEKYDVAVNLISQGMVPEGEALQAMLNKGFTMPQIQAMAQKAQKEADAERQANLYNTAVTLMESGIMPQGEALQALIDRGFTVQNIRDIINGLTAGSGGGSYGGSGSGGSGSGGSGYSGYEDSWEDTANGQGKGTQMSENAQIAQGIVEQTTGALGNIFPGIGGTKKGNIFEPGITARNILNSAENAKSAKGLQNVLDQAERAAQTGQITEQEYDYILMRLGG